jgi:hypothetical protein
MKGDTAPGRTGRLSLASLMRYVEKRSPFEQLPDQRYLCRRMKIRLGTRLNTVMPIIIHHAR